MWERTEYNPNKDSSWKGFIIFDDETIIKAGFVVNKS
jgi:hypothetical protein